MEWRPMFNEMYFDKDEMIDWRREANEEIKTMRFCPNCWRMVSIILKEHKYFHNFYACSHCGETLFKKSTVKSSGGCGYGYGNYQRYSARKGIKV